MQELLCRDYDVEAAMERVFPGIGDVFCHGSFCTQLFMITEFSGNGENDEKNISKRT